MGGSGIALALSVASAVNTAILLVMLSRAGVEGLGSALGDVALYVVKLAAFSAVAAVPVLLLRKPFSAIFGGARSGLVAYGAPFLLSAIAFAAVGVGLLALTKDKAAAFLVTSLRPGSKKRAN
jgi:putative peptidoglycan lipid II flippase